MKNINLLLLLLLSSLCFAQNWQLVWSDEFTNSISSDWFFETGGGGWGNNELQYYRQENAAVENGNLVISVKQENYGGRNYTSSRMKTQGKKFFTYGKIEARIAVPAVQGIWPAFWMLGENISSIGWPSCGEIDIMEHVNTGNTNFGTIHWANESGQHVDYGTNTEVNNITNYHTYSVEWDKNLIKWYVDGVKYHEANIANSINSTEEFHKDFFILLNVAVGGNWPGNNINNAALPLKMYVDYVRVYQDGVNVIAPTTDVITTYLDCNFTGFSGGLKVGNYTLNQLKELGVNDNTISSVKVAEGYKVTLYENDNFTGKTKVLTANNSCMGDFNDIASSIKVQTNGVLNMENTYSLENRNSGLFLDVSGGESAINDGANIHQWTGNQQKNQQFKFTHLGDGTYQILAVHSNKSLDVDNFSTANKTNVHQWTYYGTTNQQFIVYPTTDGYYKLIAKHSGKVVEVVDASKTVGANIQQYDNNNQTCGQWNLIPTSKITSIENEEFSIITIFPNPVNDKLTIESQEEIYKILIYTNAGELVMEKNNTKEIQIDFLTTGFYFLTIETKNHNYYHKSFVKN